MPIDTEGNLTPSPQPSSARVAVVFDWDVRPDTTGLYCLRALRTLCHVRHIRPAELTAVSRSAFDAFVCIDDGQDYPLPADLSPIVFWAIDTHLDLGRLARRVHGGVLVFAAQRDGVARLRQAGIACEAWLPLACDPEVHHPTGEPKRYDVAFVGHCNSRERAQLLGAIARRFPNSYVGPARWDRLASIYSSARVVFNRSIRNDINMRVFEGAACGAAVVTNDLSANGQNELFVPGQHLRTYADDSQAIPVIEELLEAESVRARLAVHAWRHVSTLHTYRHRMATLLGAVCSRTGSAR